MMIVSHRRIVVRRRRRRGQAMVEFGIVLPVFLLLVVGSIFVYSWQLDIDSAHFSAVEGVQTAAFPGSAANLSNGPSSLMCQAANRAYQAAIQQSFLRATKLYGSGGTCGAGVPDYSQSCPNGGPPWGKTKPSNQNMTGVGSPLATLVPPNQTDAIIVCVWCLDHTTSFDISCQWPALFVFFKPTDKITLDVAVAGYKPIPVNIPVLGRRMVYYGQDEEDIQEFTH